MSEDIRFIVGDSEAEYWEDLNPTVYYLRDKPYGLMSVVEVGDISYVFGSAIGDGNFSCGMISDILRMMRVGSVCLLTEVDDKKSYIREKLSRYGFVFVDGDDGVMYSYCFKSKEGDVNGK